MKWSKRLFVKLIVSAPTALLIPGVISGQKTISDTCLVNTIDCLLRHDGELSENDLRPLKARALETYAKNIASRDFDLGQIEPICLASLSRISQR